MQNSQRELAKHEEVEEIEKLEKIQLDEDQDHTQSY